MEKEPITRIPMKNSSTPPVKWDSKARAAGYNDQIIQNFVTHVTQRILAQDPSSTFVVYLENEMEGPGHYLALLIHRTKLDTMLAEELLNVAAAEAAETFGVPEMPIIVAME